MTARRPGADDSFVVAKLHKHLKEQLASTTSETEHSLGKREALIDALGYLDGVSDGRYPSSIKDGDQ